MGLFRVYYNRSEDLPFVWSVDSGTQEDEQTVMAIIILPPAVTTSQFNGERPNPDSPVGWFEVSGFLEIINDIAYFS